MPQIGFRDSRSTSWSTTPAGRLPLAALFLVVWGPAIPALAGGGFTVAGHPVAPQDVNFAGARHDSPTYGIPVQINHDTQTPASLELTVVDDVFKALLTKHGRAPLLPVGSIPVVFIADVKMRRFLEGPRRLLFGSLETELKKQQEVYVSPTAIFLTEGTLNDSGRLRTALHLGLGYLFNAEFYRAVVGLDRATPRPAD